MSSRRAGDRAEPLSLVDAEASRRSPTRVFSPGRSGRDGVPGNLPKVLSSFVGRHDDVAAVAEIVRRSRLVTVAGAGGAGKTRLALEVASGQVSSDAVGARPVELAPVFHPDATWMVELATVRDPDEVPSAVLAALLGPPSGRRTAADDLVEHLHDRRSLVLLDNCEHVLAACVQLVSRLLRTCPQLQILATSRQPLGITGERVWWLQPLPVPAPADADPRSLRSNEAVRLFVERARHVSPGFELTPGVAVAVAGICRRLDGLPLAIELAAARTAVLTPEEILDRLDDRFDLLTGGSTDGDVRHRSLRAAVEWGHDLLTAEEAAFLRRLSVFSGGWSLDAAEDVCAGDGVDRDRVLDLTASLVGKSLVVAASSGGRMRYRLLETTRTHGLATLEQAGEARARGGRHAAWYLERAEAADLSHQSAPHDHGLQGLEDDHENLRAAVAWSCDHDDADSALRLVNALTRFWRVRGHLRDGLECLRRALAAGAAEPSPARVRALRTVGHFTHLLGEHQSESAVGARSVGLFFEPGEVREVAGCDCQDVFRVCRNPLHAIPDLEEGVAAIRATSDAGRLAYALCNLGQARIFCGDTARARACFAEVLSLDPASIDGEAADEALFGLGRVEVFEGDYAAAEPLLLEVLARSERIGDPDGQSGALSVLGELHRARGNTGMARALLEQALELGYRTGTAVSIGRAELFLGGVDFAEGALDSARVRFTRALGRAGATVAYHQVRCTLGLADVAAATGDLGVAASFYAEAHDTAKGHGDDQGLARALAGRADLAGAAGDLAGARRLRHQALEIQERIGDRAAVTRALEALAALASSEGHHDRAVRLFGAASALRERFGFARPAPVEAIHLADLERARRATEPDAWHEAWEQGAALSLQEAVSYARKARGQRRRPAKGWESLTPAEREVVALVSQGLTNPEIGDRLFISRRTVGHHLSHTYAKLGIHSRRELARAAADAPPSP